jgi:hypothetical protein
MRSHESSQCVCAMFGGSDTARVEAARSASAPDSGRRHGASANSAHPVDLLGQGEAAHA